MTDTAAAGTSDLVPREWIYAGRRYRRGKVWHAWVTHDGQDVQYSKAPTGAVIGGRYEVQATEDGDKAAPSLAKYLSRADREYDDRPTLKQVEAWRLEDRAASAVVEQERARKRGVAENGNFGNLTLDEVRDLLEKQPYAVQTGTLAAVLSYLHRAG